MNKYSFSITKGLKYLKKILKLMKKYIYQKYTLILVCFHSQIINIKIIYVVICHDNKEKNR